MRIKLMNETIARLEDLGTRFETSVGGRRVIWRRFGSGPDLLLLHGGHGNWLHWVSNIEQLSRSRTLWLPDMPGFGDSDTIESGGSEEERMQLLVDSLVNSMIELRRFAVPVDVIAFSFGAFVAVRIAKCGVVRRLALVAPAGHSGRRPPRSPLAKWRGDGALPDRQAALRFNLATLMLHDPETIDELALGIYEAQCDAARFKVRYILRAGGLEADLRAFKGSLLLLWGEHDVTAIPQELAPQLAAGHMDAKWQIVQGAGHWVQYERPELVSSLLEDWLSNDSHTPDGLIRE